MDFELAGVWTGHARWLNDCKISRPAFARGPTARPIEDPIVLDHFETFEFTQDFPFGIATPVGGDSWFVYGLDPAPHARAGTRSAAQRTRLAARPRRPRHGGYDASSHRVVSMLLALNRLRKNGR